MIQLHVALAGNPNAGKSSILDFHLFGRTTLEQLTICRLRGAARSGPGNDKT